MKQILTILLTALCFYSYAQTADPILNQTTIQSGANLNIDGKAVVGTSLGIGTGTTALSVRDKIHILSNTNNTQQIRIKNSSDGTVAEAIFRADNNLGRNIQLGITSSGYTPYGSLTGGMSYSFSNAPGMIFMNDNTAGLIKFAAGGPNENMRLNTTGNLLINTTTDDGSSKLQVNGVVAVSALNLTTAPATAAGTPDLLSWNSTTKAIEKVASSSLSSDQTTLVHKTGDETIAGIKTFNNNAIFKSALQGTTATLNAIEFKSDTSSVFTSAFTDRFNGTGNGTHDLLMYSRTFGSGTSLVLNTSHGSVVAGYNALKFAGNMGGTGKSVTVFSEIRGVIGENNPSANPNGGDMIFLNVTSAPTTFTGTVGPLTERMRMKTSGNLLIGTTTDDGASKLQVNGKVSASALNLTEELVMKPGKYINLADGRANIMGVGTGMELRLANNDDTAIPDYSKSFKFRNRGVHYMTMGSVPTNGGGNDPLAYNYVNFSAKGNFTGELTAPQLTVKGKIHSREVKVTVDAGADFVFEEAYKLKPLSEVAEYISANKHLPEIASAAEMQKNGLDLGEMNIKLLQKVEELTLHLIQQYKVNQEQSALIEALMPRLKKLEQGK
jgi:hypothetical protein